MFKLVIVLPMLLAAASAGTIAMKPEGSSVQTSVSNRVHQGSQTSSYAAPAVKTIAAPIAYPAPVAVAAPAVVAAPITKFVSSENRPVVTGYTSQILKPAFPGGAGIATPEQIVTKQAVLAPARSVQTVIPQITQVEPEVQIIK